MFAPNGPAPGMDIRPAVADSLYGLKYYVNNYDWLTEDGEAERELAQLEDIEAAGTGTLYQMRRRHRLRDTLAFARMFYARMAIWTVWKAGQCAKAIFAIILLFYMMYALWLYSRLLMDCGNCSDIHLLHIYFGIYTILITLYNGIVFSCCTPRVPRTMFKAFCLIYYMEGFFLVLEIAFCCIILASYFCFLDVLDKPSFVAVHPMLLNIGRVLGKCFLGSCCISWFICFCIELWPLEKLPNPQRATTQEYEYTSVDQALDAQEQRRELRRDIRELVFAHNANDNDLDGGDKIQQATELYLYENDPSMDANFAVPYANNCVCTESPLYQGYNGPHWLSNWMIKNGMVGPNAGELPHNHQYCSHGRLLLALDVRNILYQEVLGLVRRNNPIPGVPCFIYCKRSVGPIQQPGAVYYGTDKQCLAGTGCFPKFVYREYWYPEELL